MAGHRELAEPPATREGVPLMEEVERVLFGAERTRRGSGGGWQQGVSRELPGLGASVGRTGVGHSADLHAGPALGGRAKLSSSL